MKYQKYFVVSLAILMLLCGCKKQSGDVKRRFSIDEKANYIDGIKDDDIPLIVTDYGPKGVMPIEMTDGDVWMLFSKPMVGLSKLGDVMTESVFRLNPPVKGVFRWYGSRMVSFIPSEPLKPATEYKMILNDGVKSLSGTSFHEEEPKEYTFTTETLDLQNMYPKGTNVPPNESRTIVLTFNMPIIASEVVKSLEVLVYDKEGDAYIDKLQFTTEVPTKAKYPKYEESLLSRMLVLKLNGDIPRDMDICVQLKAGAKPEPNSVGSAKEKELSFHTLKPFKYEDYYNGMYEWAENDQKNVTFKFSQPVSAENIEKYVYVTLNGFDAKKNVVVDTPPLAGNDDYDGYYSYSDWYGSYGTCLRLVNLPIDYNSSYTIEIKPGLKDIYGQTLTEPVRQSIEVGDAPMIANIPDGGDRILESDYGTKYAVGLQNVNTGKFAIQKGSDPFYRGYKQSNMADWDAVKTLEKNKFHRMSIDLTPYLNSSGKGIVNMAWDIGEYEGEDWNVSRLNLQVTNLGISVRYSGNKFAILVGQLNTGKPVQNAVVNICNKNGTIVSGKTDENGMAVIPFTASHYDMFCNYKDYNDRYILIEAITDDDKLSYKVQPYSHNLWQFGVYNTVEPEDIEKAHNAVFMFTDRGLYRPGETVTFKGVDRKIIKGKFDVYKGRGNVSVSSGNTKIFDKNITLSEFGSFSEQVTLPSDIKPGYYSIAYKRDGDKYPIAYTSFQIAEFRRVTFAVQTKIPKITWYAGDKISASVSANYLAGGAMKSFDVNYYWSKSGATFVCKNDKFVGWTFGTHDYEPWDSLSSGDEKGTGGKWSSSQQSKPSEKGGPCRYDLMVNITDVDRQMISSMGSAIVHPASYYIGAKIAGSDSDFSFVEKGKDFSIDLAAVTPESEIWQDTAKVTAKLIRTEWNVVKQQGIGGRIQISHERKEITEKETAVTLSKGLGSVKFRPEKSGSYTIELSSQDKKNRKVITKMSVYATGSDWIVWENSGSNEITIKPDKVLYNPGDTAKLLVQSPMQSGKYMLTIERENIIDQKIIDMEGNANTVTIPIDESYVPHVYVALTSYSGRTEQPPKMQGDPDLGKPKGYFGIAELNVDTSVKCIDLEITKDKLSYRPADKVGVSIKASYKGQPVPNAEITYMAADRGVLDLINYHVADPIKYFYDKDFFPLGVRGGDSRDLLIAPVTYEFDEQPGGDGGDESKQQLRKDYRPTAVFLPSLVTDANGVAKAEFTLPDSLTTYRDTAFVVTDDKFGLHEEEIMVSNPINVRTALPRKLRVSDKARAGVIVTNLSGSSQNVTVSCEADMLSLDSDTKTVTIADGDTVEVAFELSNADRSGVCTLKFGIKSDILNEIVQDTLPIEEPIVTETVTLNGRTDNHITEGLTVPKDVSSKAGGLRVTIDSTRFAMLGRAFSYLNDYPYDCLEQRMSRIFPLVQFGESSIKFGFKCPENVSYKSQINAFIKELGGYQRANGGFGYWKNGSNYSNYYLSARVYHLLNEAAQNGYAIPSNIDRSLLRNYLNTAYINDKYLSDFDKAYSCYVMALSGIDVRTKLSVLETLIERYSLSVRGFIALAYNACGDTVSAKRIFATMTNYIRVGTQTVDITQPKNSTRQNYFWNEEADMALILMCYNAFKPESSILDNLVTSIFQRANAGYWINTHTTGWILQSFAEVFKTESGSHTNFTASVKLGGNEIISQQFKNVNTTLTMFETGLDELQKIRTENILPLEFSKKGEGTLFYTAILTYPLDVPSVSARDEGLSVFGEITDLAGNKCSLSNLKLGATLRYKVHISSGQDRQFVAVRIPLPAGAEPIDGSFVTSALIPPQKSNNPNDDEYDYDWMSSSPVQEIHDTEVLYFIDRFSKGKTTLEFCFRTTTPGVYQVPPITAECMYQPEVFGRTSGVVSEIK